MKYAIYFLSLCVCFLSCDTTKNIIDSDDTTKNVTDSDIEVLKYLPKEKQIVTFSGNSKLFSGDEFSGTMVVDVEKKEALGELFINGKKSQSFKLIIPLETLIKIRVKEFNKRTFTIENVLEEKNCTISGFKVSGLKKSGKLDFGTTSSNFTITTGGGNPGETSKAVIWKAAVVATLLTTVTTCAYERTAAKLACQAELEKCTQRCGIPCLNNYSAGSCRYTCLLLCN